MERNRQRLFGENVNATKLKLTDEDKEKIQAGENNIFDVVREKRKGN
jgi:hypothetical protein